MDRCLYRRLLPAAGKTWPTQPDITRGYFGTTDMTRKIISPALHPEVTAKFPPTLIITGTRAMDMSPATYTNSQLLKAGVHSTLDRRRRHGPLLYLPVEPARGAGCL